MQRARPPRRRTDSHPGPDQLCATAIRRPAGRYPGDPAEPETRWQRRWAAGSQAAVS